MITPTTLMMPWLILFIAGLLEIVWPLTVLTIAAVLGILLFKEPVTAARIGCIALIVGAIVGLRVTSGH